MTTRIGLIGLGRMGGGIAANLLKAGVPLTVLAGPRRTGVDALLASGAREAASAADLAAGSDLVLTSLPASDIVEALVTGERGLLAGAGPGTVHLDLTSGEPAATRRIAAAWAARGLRFADGGVLGSPEHAARGELILMLGADEALAEAVRPMLSPIAREVLRVGDTGAGHTLKLTMGFIGMAIAGATAEALTIARAASVDIETMRRLIGGTAMDSGTFQAMVQAAMDGDTARRKLSIASGRKDVGYLLRLAGDLGITTSVLAGTHATLGRAADAGHADSFVPALTSILCALDGVAAPEPKG